MDGNKVEGSKISDIELLVVDSCKRFDSIGTKTRRSHNLSAKTYLKGIIVYITAPKVSLLGGFSTQYHFAVGLKVVVLDTNWLMFDWKPLKGKSLNLTDVTKHVKPAFCWTLKVSATAEVGFFFILLAYALTGLTYNFKDMDYFMLGIWITYFLFSFRLDKNYETQKRPSMAGTIF